MHTVTAFAVGHSVTLALATTGVVHAPTRVVEVLIAVSIAVSAVHALTPLTRRGEVAIAAGFGLVHGLAFAQALTQLALSSRALVVALLGFNTGVELVQLLVVGLTLPPLLLLTRSTWYGPSRVIAAGVAAVLAVAWSLERVGLLQDDPSAPLTAWGTSHPNTLVAVLALLAVAARLLSPAGPRAAAHAHPRGGEGQAGSPPLPGTPLLPHSLRGTT